MALRTVVIAGGSIAGFTAADELRRSGFDGTIRIIADEPRRTYERPPLSKEVLGGANPDATAWDAAHDDDLGIDWVLGRRASSLAVEDRKLTLDSGDVLDFDGLVIATGASPRRLPDTDHLAGVHVVRTLDDCLGLRADLDAAPSRVVVVGAGFIGAEVAATCRQRGLDVTLVDPLSQPMVGVVGDTVGAAVADLHRDHGVDVRLEVGVESLRGGERVEQVVLDDGTELEADVVVVGIGVVPNTAWLDGSGLPVGNGVEADRTTLVAPGITACGDVASWDSPRYGRVRIEHWDHAVDMGRAAGARLLADDDAAAEVFDPVPWFWSDQYDLRLQVAGRIPKEARMQVADGAVADDKFVALYGDDDRVLAALGWNWPAKTVRYRMALEDGVSWPS